MNDCLRAVRTNTCLWQTTPPLYCYYKVGFRRLLRTPRPFFQGGELKETCFRMYSDWWSGVFWWIKE